MNNEQAALRRDEEARNRIANDLDTTFLVEAGAGSGKTTSIVGRMIALIKTGKAEARHIAAITFTNKAAAELTGRFRMRLERECADAATEAEKARLEAALRQMPECFIGTIHAFCAGLLRERPIEAGLDPAFREIDELEDRELRESSWDQYLTALRERGDTGELDKLLAMQIHAESLKDVYERVSRYEDVAIYMKETARPDLQEIRDSLLPMLEAAAPHIPANEPKKGWDALQRAIRHAVRYVRNRDMSDEMNMLALLGHFDRGLGVTQNRWNDRAAARRFRDEFQHWRIDVLQPFLTQWREFLHPQAVSFVLPAVRFNRDRRMREGRLNFQDLLTKAAELLRSRTEARRYFARRFRVLFVDEFQDTDPIQAEMMLLLTGADTAESNWRKSLPRPGSLFVVGDPKQSIYRFRRADISTYNFVKAKIAASGAVLQLTRNFRSVKAIGDYVNYAFESKFAQPGSASDCQAPYVRMLTALPNPAAAGKKALHGVYTATVPKRDYDRQADIAAFDAARTAAFIAWACAGKMTVADKDGNGNPLARPAVPGDFLILLKYRKYIGLYARWLEYCGVASDTSGSVAVTEELAAVRQLACALDDTDDAVGLLGVLRGRLFGISDDELYHYRREGGRIELCSVVDEAKLSGKGKRVEEALRKLREYREWTRSQPALAAFSRILDDTGLIAAAAGGESGGAIRSGTLIRLLETLQGDAEAALNWAALAKRLVRLTEEEGLESSGLPAGSGTAVRIMNLHKAKGLEAPVVWLACPCGDFDHDAAEHVDRLSDPPLGYFTISRQRDSHTTEVIAQPAGWAERGETERLFMHAEKERLLYVAATRAKQLLVVSAYPSRPAIDPWSPLAESLQHQPELEMRDLQPAAGEELDAAPAVEEWRMRRDERMRAAARPTYRVDSVTGLAKAAGRGGGEARQADGEHAGGVSSGTGGVHAGGVSGGTGEECGGDASGIPGGERAASLGGIDGGKDIGRKNGVPHEAFDENEAIGGSGADDRAKAASPVAPGGRRAEKSMTAGTPDTPRSVARGGGMAYGTLVHRCLQAVGEGMEMTDLSFYCRLVAREEGVDEQWVELAEAAVRQTVQSELWRRSVKAKQRYFEFSLMTARTEEERATADLWHKQTADGNAEANRETAGESEIPGPAGQAGPVVSLLRGVIDLVFEEGDGWVIADFKTDYYERADQEKSLVAHYKPQVLAYAEEWQRTVGGTVKEAGLYFVQAGRYVEI